ncbi:MAG: OmpA family protein [Rhodospirillales bacterium]|nr:OmpA family protein [Rhodospirillales bacterium]
MIGFGSEKPGIYGRLPWAGLASCLVAGGLIAGCTWLPDAANPVEWYKGATNAVTGDGPSAEKKQAMARAKPLPGEGKSFPNLASVPDRPHAPSADEREKLAGGLVADRQHARYTDDVVRGRVLAKAAPKPSENPVLSQQAVAPPPADVTPPRQLAATPPPPARMTPPTGQLTAAPSLRQAPPPARIARSTTPLPKLVFGAPPTDIAIARTAVAPARARAPGSLATDSSRTLRAPAFRRDAAARAGQVAVVRFAVGSTRLGPAARRQLRKVARMQRDWQGSIRVVGHASSRTGDMDLVKHNLVNFQVSLDRAQSVARELMRLGVAPRNLRVGASSDSDPVFFEVMPSGESGNRRVEIYFEGRG